MTRCKKMKEKLQNAKIKINIEECNCMHVHLCLFKDNKKTGK